jgi:phosphinothricin acetyltransferase
VTSVSSVLVRAGAVDDLPALTDLYNHYVLHDHATFDVEPFAVEARRVWFDHYADTGPHRLLVAELAGTVAGYATSSAHRAKPAYATSVETTVYCAPDVVGKGVGSALYAALLDVLAREDVHRAYAGVALPNDASVRLHERFGFRELGTFHEVGRKHGRWVDVRWFERPLP